MNLQQEWRDFKRNMRIKFLILFPWLIAPLAIFLLVWPDSIFMNHAVIFILVIRIWVSK